MTMPQIVFFANDRCNQENVIGQLKSGVKALRMLSDGLMSNWAYMVIAALAWNLKAWYGLVTLEPAARRDILRMEFKRFLGSFVQVPCRIVATGRRLNIFRVGQIFRLLPRLHSLSGETCLKKLGVAKVNNNQLLACVSDRQVPPRQLGFAGTRKGFLSEAGSLTAIQGHNQSWRLFHLPATAPAPRRAP